jgi:polar amino acid transport system substrate-binding protein
MGPRRSVFVVAGLSALLLLAGACRQEPTPTDTGDQTPGAPEFTTIEEGVLTVGSDIPFTPFEYREGGELTGLDIDLMNAIAERLEIEVDYVDAVFDTIFTDLAAGQFDAVISASTITPEREQEVNFSDGYFRSLQALTVQAGAGISSFDDLGEGHVVAVQSGTTGQIWAEDNLQAQGAEIRAFPEAPQTYDALEAGQVDGVVFDESSAIPEAAARPGLEVADTVETGEVYGIAVNPENQELLDAINQALAQIIEDGTYDEIYDSYPDCSQELVDNCLVPGGRITAAA